MKIDFVSDVSCPWCAIGLNALEQALDRVAPDIQATLHFQPFELNPQMPAEGQDTVEHLSQKYGIDAAQIAANAEAIRQRGASVGFTFGQGQRKRIYNTFDAHRLLAWAETVAAPGVALQLKHALFSAYFTEGLNPGAHEVLLDKARSVGLDGDSAAQVLASDAYAEDVREREAFWTGHGIHSVPAVILNQRWLVSGGQPVEAFENALRQAAQSPVRSPAQAQG